ncbi:hypothetical protein HK096_010889, partial [Nowakowskiella sp. JEL0078]
MQFAYQQNNKISTVHRIRALSVVFQLAGPKELKEMNMEYNDIKDYMTMLLYLADFEELRISQTLKEFTSCDKEALARSLWLNHNSESKVVQLLCNICLDYGICDLILWENALERLLYFKAYRYLLGVLEQIGSSPKLSQMKALPRLWNDVLYGMLLIFMENPNESSNLFERVLTLIQKCPFLPELQVDRFALLFENITKKYSANEDVKTQTTKINVQILDILNAKTDDRFEQSGILGVLLTTEIVEKIIFDNLDLRSAYEILTTGSHGKKFCEYLIDEDKAENVIGAL